MNKRAYYKLRYVARNHPKVLVALIASVFMLVAAGFAGAGYAVYKAASLTTAASASIPTEWTRDLTQLPEKASGYVEAAVLVAASDWLLQQAAKAEVAHVARGLSCFDALGGPSPTEVVDHVQSKLADKSLETDLRSIRQTLSVSMPPANAPSACASWLIGS